MLTITQRRTASILAVLAVLGNSCLVSIANGTVVSGNQITWRFTARDFLPAACFNSYPELAALWSYSEHMEEWGYSVDDPPTAYPDVDDLSTVNRYRGNDSLFCPIWNDIAEGNFNGHPDFETSTFVYTDGCSGVFDDLTSLAFGGIPCFHDDTGSISKIIEDYLEFDNSGVPKPVYCKNPPFLHLGDRRCGWRTQSHKPQKRVATSGEEYFRMWYRDVQQYNLRSGFSLNLTINETTNVYSFSSGEISWFPLNQYANAKPCLNTDLRLDCSNGGRIFPFSNLAFRNESAINQSYAFTVESHFFFDFQGNETFSFTGDDDFWVFINERLAVDVGGLHTPLTAKIDLSVQEVRDRLGLEVGGVYAFDLFHAERHTGGTNFAFQTSFQPKCTVLQSGVTAHKFDPITVHDDWKFVGGPTWGLFDSATESMQLTNAADLNTASYVFLKQQINMGTGFVAEFVFTSTGGPGEGFVFVLQRDSIVDKNGGTGGNLGFRNTLNSVGIVFDFCSDRDNYPLGVTPQCRSREVRMHVGEDNSVSNRTKLLHSPLLFPNHLNDGLPHRVMVRYFSIPDWIDVLIDDDLFLQKRGFNLSHALGGRNAFVGFTASTGSQISSTLRIHDFNVRTVAIRNNLSRVNLPTSEPVRAVANGRSEAVIPLTNYDSCGNKIQFGGYSSFVTAHLISESGEPPVPLKAVEDPDTGIYLLKFSHTTIGMYHLAVWFGNQSAGCNETVLTNPPECFYALVENAVQFVPFDPESEPSTGAALSLRDQLLVGFGVTAGTLLVLGCFAVMYVFPAKREWNRDKKYIEAGKLAAMERGIIYEGDLQIEIFAQKLQRVMEEVSRLRANRLAMQTHDEEIRALLHERGELEASIRMLKQHKAEFDNAPNFESTGGSGRSLSNLLKPLTPKRSPRIARFFSQGNSGRSVDKVPSLSDESV